MLIFLKKWCSTYTNLKMERRILKCKKKNYQNTSIAFSLAKSRRINISLATALDEHESYYFNVLSGTLITLTGPFNASIKQSVIHILLVKLVSE